MVLLYCCCTAAASVLCTVAARLLLKSRGGVIRMVALPPCMGITRLIIRVLTRHTHAHTVGGCHKNNRFMHDCCCLVAGRGLQEQ